ncbi:hypothetical protein CHY_1300 [Carboxydothermus hydrogenoformans Z-2901]|uniref:Uncharacterized protein n=1 Tax=Carboxydothermus hydrogenoformans (strain ATCC BAA-161 / DSM 6008 / Z-2901) TaxID=246194 RepID=Q3ACK0_CARHZ|nr:hypothetical protein CHY_1300 [Carboxydothermus hydrogenoformans Z-2901]
MSSKNFFKKFTIKLFYFHPLSLLSILLELYSIFLKKATSSK